VSSDLEPARVTAEDRVSLAEALRREQRVSAALREVGIALGTTLDLDDLLELILTKLTELVEADRATLYLLDEAHDELVSRLVVGGQVRSIRMKVGHGVAGMVAATGKPIRLNEAYQDPRFERDWDLLTGYRTTSMLAAPLKNHLGRTIGVIQVLNKRHSDGFSSDDEAILSALSTQAAVAIDNSRLFLSLIQKNKQLLDTKEQLERRVRDLSLLFELERATARATTVEELCLAALAQLTAACEARGAAMLLAEPETGDLVQYVYDDQEPERLLTLPVKSGEGVLGAAMLSKDALRIPDLSRDVRASLGVERKFSFFAESALAVALEGERGALGALGVFSAQGSPPLGDEDTGLLRLMGANVSTAVRLFNANAVREREERLSAIGRLLSQVIHDFKTPMTAISGYAQLMAEDDDRASRQENCEEILRQFDVLSAMQREVLEFARGERSLFVRRVYLRKFFSDVERQLRLEIDGRPIELAVEVDGKAVVRFDEGRMERAIHNLARNAVEAMTPAGGKLTLSAGLVDGELSIKVGDTGPGIPKEIESKLFQSFVTLGKEGGTGLGLAIVKKIVDEHGGRVTFQSSPEGATFELRLPQPSLSDKAAEGLGEIKA
jgi:signal transduction histidine kinase/putative methionine-R-sulfoxide reductase with GAF domain